jgi:two-component system, OmpR family, phosphate regulon sensor histidine kinase PhoR
MKRTLPVIIILITISLLGIIYVQFNWIENAAQVKEEQLKEKVYTIMDEVGQQLVEQKKSPDPFKVPWAPGVTSPGTDFDSHFSVTKKFSESRIKEKLQNAFDARGLGGTHFEFAVLPNVSATLFPSYHDLESDNFRSLLKDTIDNLRLTYPLIPPANSMLDAFNADEVMVVVLPHYQSFVFRSIGWMIVGASFFTLTIIAAFFLTVNSALRQKKLSEIKGDFINNMTHEFKTPLATISLAVDALKNEKVLQDRTKLDYFSGIIKEENRRMNKQVETILQAAQLDKQEVQLNRRSLHAHELIKNAIDNLRLQLEQKGGVLETNFQATRDLVSADEVHFVNLLSNILDNAVKYAKDNLKLKVSTRNVGKMIRIIIEDNGIGMSRETINRIFERFYRAHTGNLHNVKGFGLGMSYVKSMVDAHHGKIKVESTLGKDSTFILDFPLSSS